MQVDRGSIWADTGEYVYVTLLHFWYYNRHIKKNLYDHCHQELIHLWA